MSKPVAFVAALLASLLLLTSSGQAASWGTWVTAGRPAGAALSPRAQIVPIRVDGHFTFYAVGQDGRLYASRAGRWGVIGAPAASALSTTAAVTPLVLGPGHFVLYATGRNGLLYARGYRSGRGWSRWAVIGRPAGAALSTTSPVAAVLSRSGTETVFAVGQDGQVYLRSWSRGAWGPWAELARPAAAAVSVTARLEIVRRPNHLSIYAVGADGQLYVRAFVSGRWAPWVLLGRPDASALSPDAEPVVTDVGATHLSVFAVGQDGQAYTRSYTAPAWGAWTALGRPAESGLSTGAPVATVSGDALHRDVIAVGQDGALYTSTWTAGAWQAWSPIGRPMSSPLSTGAPVDVLATAGRIALLAVGRDGRLYVSVSPVPA
jgi:hypothetical protein